MRRFRQGGIVKIPLPARWDTNEGVGRGSAGNAWTPASYSMTFRVIDARQLELNQRMFAHFAQCYLHVPARSIGVPRDN